MATDPFDGPAPPGDAGAEPGEPANVSAHLPANLPAHEPNRTPDESPGEWLGESLRAAAEGDERAWRRVVGHYVPRVFALLRARCGDADLAEEITQSTFCTLASKIATYVESGKFESWLFLIAVNRLRDEQRRRGRHAVATDDAVLATVPDASRSRVAPVAAAELRGALDAAIAKLAPADQRVVQLRHVGGLSFKQIADVLSEPLGTVLARHHRALRKLRDLLGGQDDP